ncbi:RNase adapter RapZ [Yoonia sp.]|uniref:RNase adapter RapZ n=1 Tax=Yoonia sp. TaxID=2212373 RepID=UPI00236EA3EF|nr:RNase adapter RapZ [Yoonia sp.]MDB4111229.1 RNase adapter RapZ [Yoonia sp.]
MTERAIDPQNKSPSIVLVTGPSGAGRSTAINALEDLGYEVIDNLPLSLLPRLLEGPPPGRPLALGLDVRNRDFGVDALIAAIDQLAGKIDISAQVLYLDADEEELVKRYSETRRRHPLAPAGPPLAGIAAERELLVPVRARADVLIETTGMSPHDLRAEIEQWFGTGEGGKLGVTLHSFSYKRGLPRGMDIVMDCRFLRNPHWDEALRARDGRDPDVAAYVAADPRFEAFFSQVKSLIDLLLPAHKDEGKAHLSIGFGCTGGKHRSVMMTEGMASALAQDGWHVSKRHRELERRLGQGSKENAV